jgi:hypothetical protein
MQEKTKTASRILFSVFQDKYLFENKLNILGKQSHTYEPASCSVANSWRMFSASTKKFGRWQKNSAAHIILSWRLFVRPLIFLGGHFRVLRPKIRPVGNTG